MAKTPLTEDEKRQALDFVRRAATALRAFQEAADAAEMLLGLESNIRDSRDELDKLMRQVDEAKATVAKHKEEVKAWDRKVEDVKHLYQERVQEVAAALNSEFDKLNKELEEKKAAVAREVQEVTRNRDRVFKELLEREEKLKKHVKDLDDSLLSAIRRAKSLEEGR